MQNDCVRTKRSHQTSCLVEDCRPRTRKVLCDQGHLTTNISPQQGGALRKWLLRIAVFREAYLVGA